MQSSTALWAAIPDIMADALETHHRLIRRLIAKYKCYEVKTIGDSFMIACKSASAAVQLVVDLQRTFLQHDWGRVRLTPRTMSSRSARRRRTRTTSRPPRGWTLLCTASIGADCECVRVCTLGSPTSGTTR
ncbi:adenylate/guanylate cyclase domain-containing protein [Streptomyces hygroscopicus]|uniref:adenylate/guanylate cyclase domain-containing protein n=1 Tax=Streptomyces hygroscopicus TaxID=1912 RepID=UPI003F1D62A6